MDGAKGSGANAQEYDFARWNEVIQSHEGKAAGYEADCLMFQAEECTLPALNAMSLPRTSDALAAPLAARLFLNVSLISFPNSVTRLPDVPGRGIYDRAVDW